MPPLQAETGKEWQHVQSVKVGYGFPHPLLSHEDLPHAYRIPKTYILGILGISGFVYLFITVYIDTFSK